MPRPLRTEWQLPRKSEQEAEQPSQLLDVKFLLLNCARAVPTNEVDDHLVLETLERCDLDAHLLLEQLCSG